MATEIVEKRDLYTKHYDKGNGVVKAIIESKPVHYKNQDGKFKNIDTNIVPITEWEFQLGVKDNIYKAYFNDETKENIHLVSFEFINDNNKARWINYKLKDALPSGYEIKGNELIYYDCFNNIDVRYKVTEQKLKEDIILKSKPDKSEFTFTLKLEGVNYYLDDQKSVIFEDQESKEVIWKLDAPYMEDAEGIINHGVEYSLGNDGTFDTLTLSIIDLDFLDSGSYPIVVDPTTTLQDIGMDRFNDMFIDYYGSGSHINDNYLDVGSISGTDRDRTIFIKFPITNEITEDNIEIIKAQFQLYCTKNNNGIDNAPVYLTLDDWTEDDSSIPSIDDTKILGDVVNNLGVVGDYWTWDITQVIKKWQEDSPNYGFAIKKEPKLSWYDYCRFNSSESQSADLRPKLIIQYLKLPTLMFKDIEGDYLSDNRGNIFKYLNLGTMTAGQESIPKLVQVENLCDFDIGFLEVFVDQDTIGEGIDVKISKYKNPYIWEDHLYFSGTLTPRDMREFYVKLSSNLSVKSGGNFDIKVKAKPI